MQASSDKPGEPASLPSGSCCQTEKVPNPSQAGGRPHSSPPPLFATYSVPARPLSAHTSCRRPAFVLLRQSVVAKGANCDAMLPLAVLHS